MARKSGLAALMSGQPLPTPPKRRLLNRKKLRTFLLHSGLVFLCMLYITLGAVLFYSLERPVELDIRDKTIEALKVEQEILMKVSASMNDNFDDLDFEAFNSSIAPLLDEYESALFEMFSDPISANVFDSIVYNENKYIADMWTPSSSVLFAATTMVPVGFGLITPSSSMGKMLLICYAIIGIPLALVTTSDLGKFFCLFTYKLLNESMKASMAIFIILLILYPFGGGIIISLVSDMTWIDSVYYCIMTIFTIGYGDFQPPIPVVFLIIFIVVGVTLVTVSIEVVGSDIIHHIHYMGRQMGRAKEIAGKMMQIAQKLSINRGLGLGMAQLGAFAKFGMMMRVDTTHHNGDVLSEDAPDSFRSRKDTAFEPEIHIDFVDGFNAF
uniref:Ion channel n=1 Tax=Steinernema glaseri TaxID=37863 RepID=A0A1I7Y3J9_9BILA